ncbi:phospholipid-transporting ATPase ABCA1-like isoform X2 [Coccinella septempunctata]|uniref:phospholipid-transporting ATPase ABCA1-like isoform X2 n=1 Tax=Coccinella septempunctata TaxID=41139 RepID=UPI001D06CD6B|nr:phospholipid-transporting ATPase ABCA1-like isoform X2 [Coccinella septempunctata]
MAHLKQLRLVLWKNSLIRKRHWVLTLFEILLPILLFILVSYSRSKISGIAKQEIVDPTYSEPIHLSEKGEIYYTVIDISSTLFFYAPSNNLTDELIRRLQIKLQVHSNEIISFSSKEELLKEFSKVNQTLIAIIFNSNDVKKLDYDIRFYDQYVRGETNDLYLSELQYSNYGLNSYFQSGFMTIQTTLDLAYIEMLKNSEVPVYLTMQEFPYPPYKSDAGLIHIFMPFLSHITIFSFIFLCPALIMRIIEEKSTGTRELLKMVGLKSWMLWFGWFLHAFLPNFVSVILIVILMKVPMWGIDTPPIEYCNAAIFFIFLFLYLIASITFCFAISSLFNRPFFGVVVGIVFWILSYTIPENFVTNVQTYKAIKLILALFPNMCLSYGYKTMTIYEAREIGVNWSNMFEPGSETNDEITMGTVWVMFVVDIIVYMLVTLYVSNVFPGPYGIPRSWNFPLEYLGTMCNNKVTNGDGTEPLDASDSHSDNGIEIKNLRKTFGTTVAVNNLSMNIKKNQITVLLGHNGAGKTTTMSMITGMINYNKGRIKVYDHDIKSEEKQVRKLMGLCPQHNLLFNDLTVYEHLMLIGGLKGASMEDVKKEADDLLQLLKLEKKKDAMVSCLSGGMKRKLCLAMAVIGRSQVLVLDEPTAGMDPESQREVWTLLLKWRGTKTILISTHYMDEADALADWIAIMANGEKQCFGTPMELKDKFKTGYHLSLMLMSTENLEEISSTIYDVIPKAKLKEQHGNNVVYILPIEDKCNFSKLLSILEMRKSEFKINNISINITTLEDVFLSSRKELEPSVGNEEYIKDDLKLPTFEPSIFLPLLLKRIYFLQEKPLSYIIPVILTLLLTLLTIYLGQTSTDSTKGNKLNIRMNLGVYGPTEVFFSANFDDDVNPAFAPFVERLKNFYHNEAKSEKSYTVQVNSTSDGIIKRGIQNLPFYKNHMVAAAEFNVSKDIIRVNAMYSHFAIHGPPISLNLVMNAIAKAELGNEYSITTSNEPLNKVKRIEPTEESEVQVGLLWLILFPLGLAFLMACFIIFPHMELSTGFIQLQIMCGASSLKYWLSNFLFDFGLYIISTVFIVSITWGLAITFDWRDFMGAMGPLSVIMVFYGLATIPFAYLFTRFKTASSGYAVLLIVSLLSGVILTIIVNALEQAKDDYYTHIGYVLHLIFLLLFPHYGVSYVSINYGRKAVQNYNWYTMSAQKRRAVCRFHDNPCCFGETTPECIIHKDYFQNEELGIWKDLWKMIFPFILYFTINVLLESDCFKFVSEEINKLIYRRTSSEESLGKKDVLYSHNLTKYIGGEQVVKGVQFEVDRGKCYGLLGVNGAGKTTTFRMLTKEIMKSDGKSAVFKDEGNVEDESRTYLQQIGYCPQNNCLNFALTARQLLKIFAYFRGYPYKHLDFIANHFLKMMQLESLADKPCGVYSGGNKRKLCLALALMGYPPNIFLDEPTNGVDPVSRRIFWNIIKEMQTQKKLTFLLTSHSMQECEALCSKLGIMKDGHLECNDTIPHLKEKYHTGFTVKLKLKQKNLKPNKKNVDQLLILAEKRGRKSSVEDFPDSFVMHTYAEEVNDISKDKERKWSDKGDSGDSVDSLDYIKHILESEYDGELKDEHPGLLHYHVKPMQASKKTMSKLFEDMEELKNKCGLIEDYIVTETTVEDVFLTVAKADSVNGSSNKTSNSSSEKSSKASSKKNSKSSSESSKSYMV